MEKLLMLIWLLSLFTPIGNAEELPWFSLNCNLDNADFIIESKIIDNQGNLEIENFLKGHSLGVDTINIEKFSIDTNEELNPGFPKKIGARLVLFISAPKDKSNFEPAFWTWSLSTLWIEDNEYLGVYQPTIPGGYQLHTCYEDKNELTTKIDNWIFLENTIDQSNEIEISKHRINYLISLFKWHPFKEDILNRLLREENIEPEILIEQIWDVFYRNYYSKSELYPCGWRSVDTTTYYQLTFKLFENLPKEDYEIIILRIINRYKRSIDNMERKASTAINERFILAFSEFMNENPISQWNAEKEEITTIINENENFYNKRFLESLRNEID